MPGQGSPAKVHHVRGCTLTGLLPGTRVLCSPHRGDVEGLQVCLVECLGVAAMIDSARAKWLDHKSANTATSLCVPKLGRLYVDNHCAELPGSFKG